MKKRKELSKEKLGKTIRELRMDQGKSLRKLAEESRISSGYLSMVENGKYRPSDMVIEEIAERLGVSVNRILDKSWA